MAALVLPPLVAGAATSDDRHGKTLSWRYTVRPGDTLINIAARYLAHVGQWPEIQRDNAIDDSSRLVPGTVLRIPVAMLRRAPADVVLENVSGDVRWRLPGADWQMAGRGQRLPAGSRLETLAGASVLLRLADGGTVRLSANSSLEFDTLGAYAGGLMVDTRLRLQQGQAEIFANPDRGGGRYLRIYTPSAQAAVRGTQFRIGVDGGVTWQETLSGQVAVSAAGRRVSVPAGQGTVARRGEPPLRPVTLPPAPETSGFPTHFGHSPVRFPLPALGAAKAWLGEVVLNESFDRVLFSERSDGEWLTFPDLPTGGYVLRLRGVDANGLQGRVSTHRFVVALLPASPSVVSQAHAPDGGHCCYRRFPKG
ncbi:MAG TPA: FecR domain-containing protein [Accumulibacter sp.]|nr:FecR domain-containing protein [Accumulibacter sp.]HQC80621.1 FecR domain-containing protein [Accumulibacter sp.]